MVLAIVEYPDGDPIGGEETSHPNGAIRLLGLAFGNAEAGPMADAAAQKLTLSGFKYLPQPLFEKMFGGGSEILIALRFQIASCDRAALVLQQRGVHFAINNGAIAVPAQGVLGCGIEFVERGRA